MIRRFDNYIKEQNSDAPSILFINGFRHWAEGDGLDTFCRDEDTSDVICQFGDGIIHTFIDWKSGRFIYNSLRDKINNNNIKGIVGFSAGGFLSFYLSNRYKIPALSINPAMASTSAAPELQPLPEDIKNSSIYNNQTVIIGDLDSKESKGVDGKLVIKKLENLNFGGEILLLRNT
jgi:hypothetical protein